MGDCSQKLQSLDIVQAGIKRISQGQLDTQISVDSKDELGDFANAFNYMTEHLNATMATRNELEKTVAERTAALEKSCLAAISVMEDANIQRKKLEETTASLQAEIAKRTQAEQDLADRKAESEKDSSAD